MSRGGRDLLWSNDPTQTSNLDGIWKLNEVNNHIARDEWPTIPDAVSDLAVTPGDGILDLSWTAPSTNGIPISLYSIEYTPSGGSAVTVTTSNTSYQITGLTNDTEYSVRVGAIIGDRVNYGAAVTGTPASGPLITVSSNISGTGTSADPWRATNFNWREFPYDTNSRTPSPTFTAGGSVTVTIQDAQYNEGREYDGDSFPVHSFVYVNGSQVGGVIVVDGSGDTRTVNLNAGDVLSFRWQWDNGANFTDAMPGGLRVYV